MAVSLEDQTHAIWVNPTRFDPTRHSPPYLPSSLKLGSGPADSLRRMAECYEGDFGWLSALLVLIRAAGLVHQAHHWQTRGSGSYGDHLLFGRLYEQAAQGVDPLAERAVGLGGPGLVDPALQAGQTAACLASVRRVGADGMVEVSLAYEQAVLAAIKTVIGVLKERQVLTDGTENLLQDLADKHEELVYLLRQRRTACYSYAR